MIPKKTDLSLSVELGLQNLKLHTHDKTSANRNVFWNTPFLFGLIVRVIFHNRFYKTEPLNNWSKQTTNYLSVFLGGERQWGFFI